MKETDALAGALGRVLHELPPRRAPPTLEARVLGELARRAALPWWRRTFSHWPLLARTVFLVICAALVRLALLEGTAAVAGVRSLHDSGVLSPPWTHDVSVLAATAGYLFTLSVRAVPPAWAYAGVAAGAMLYAVLFGLAAVMYRTLYLQPKNAGKAFP
jgi:hypothetical protein